MHVLSCRNNEIFQGRWKTEFNFHREYLNSLFNLIKNEEKTG